MMYMVYVYVDPTVQMYGILYQLIISEVRIRNSGGFRGPSNVNVRVQPKRQQIKWWKHLVESATENNESTSRRFLQRTKRQVLLSTGCLVVFGVRSVARRLRYRFNVLSSVARRSEFVSRHGPSSTKRGTRGRARNNRTSAPSTMSVSGTATDATVTRGRMNDFSFLSIVDRFECPRTFVRHYSRKRTQQSRAFKTSSVGRFE